MKHERHHGREWAHVLTVALTLLALAPVAWAQDAGKPPAPDPKPTMTVYGFAMIDVGQNFTQIDPDWYDTMKVTKLPSYKDQFGKDNSFFAGVRQTRSREGLCADGPGRSPDEVRDRPGARQEIDGNSITFHELIT